MERFRVMREPEAWRVNPDLPLSWRQWQDEYVVFNPLTGNTHVLDAIAGEILLMVERGPIPWRELRRHMAEFLEAPDDQRLAEAVLQAIGRLDELVLIEPVP